MADHHNKYNENENVSNVGRIIKTCHRARKPANAAGQIAPIGLFDWAAASLPFVKGTVSLKCNTIRSAFQFYLKLY